MHAHDLVECLEFGNLVGTLRAHDFLVEFLPRGMVEKFATVIPIARLRAEG